MNKFTNIYSIREFLCICHLFFQKQYIFEFDGYVGHGTLQSYRVSELQGYRVEFKTKDKSKKLRSATTNRNEVKLGVAKSLNLHIELLS